MVIRRLSGSDLGDAPLDGLAEPLDAVVHDEIQKTRDKIEIEGKEVVTIEGLQKSGTELDEIQKAFVDNGGIQCGFCTPGMIMSTKSLLDLNPSPTSEDIKTALAGNLCRCTGYVQIIESVEDAAKRRKNP